MKKQKSKKAQKEQSDEDSQEYQECECCKRKQLIETQSKKLQFDQAMIDLLNQTSKKLPANVNLDCIVTPNGMKLIFEQKPNKNTQKVDSDSSQKQQVFESFSKQVRENPEILNEVFPYNERIYQVDLDNYLFKDGKQIYETQWLLNELDQKNCFREEYLPVMKYIDLEKFETGIKVDAVQQIFGDVSNAFGEEQKTIIENLKDKIKKEQEQRIKEYLKIHYNDTKIIKRIIAPGDHVEQYYSKNAKDWFKENVIKLIKDKNEKGQISIQENTIISSKDFQQTASEFFQQIESTGSTGSDGQNCEIQEVFNESSQFIMAMNERKNMAADQSPGDMKCFQQNLTMMAFLKPNAIKCSTVISSQNFTVKTSISSQDSPKKKSRNKEIKFYQDCAILDALPFGFGQIDNFIRRRDCEGTFKENFIDNDKYLKDKQQLIKKKGQHTFYKFTMSILDGGCGDIRSFKELKVFQSQRNKFNYNQVQQSKAILPTLMPLCQISLKDDQQSENQMYFVLQYLNRTKIGEASYNFIPQSLHTYLVCRQFGKCSLSQNQNIVGLKCFCKRNIVLFINLIQKKELIADNRDNVNRALSQFLYRGYDILIFNDITKKQKFKETFQTDQVFQINHQLKLMEIDLHDLKLQEEESAPSKIYKYRIQAHKDLHNTRYLYFLMTQIHEKLFYGQQNNFKCFSLYDCRKLAILENYAMQTLLVKQTGLLLMNEMIPADQIQNYDATIEFQRNHNEIDSNFALYVLIQICLAQNLQQSASKYFELLSKNEQIERPISDKSTTNHNRKCEAFSINIEKDKCKNLCFLNNNIKNMNQMKDLKIQSHQPKIDQQFWNETDKKLKWIGIEEIIQDNLLINDKKTDKNKQNDQICVIKNILQYGDDPDSYKSQTDLKSLKKVIKQQVYGIKISVRILSNTEWIQRKKIDNFDGMKIQPIILINEFYHEVKINNQNKNYWFFILRCMNLGEISEFWVNSNSEQNQQLIEFIQEIQPQFFDQWSKQFRQTQVSDVLQRNPLQITLHKLKVNNQPCNIFNSAQATSYVLHHQIHKNYADNIFEEYQSKFQKNDQQIFPEFDKNNPNLQKCMKIYSQQQKQIQSNLQFYTQQNEKQKDSIIAIYVEILTKLSLIYLGLNIWSKSIKLSNKSIEVDSKNQFAIYIRSLALLGKIQQKMKLKNDCKNYKCHICLKQADCARSSLVQIIRQYSLDLEELTTEIKENQQKIFQTSKIEPEQIAEINKLQSKIDSINTQVTEAIKAMQHAAKIIQKIKPSIQEKNVKDLHQISLESEGELLEQHQFFQKINEKTLSILMDKRINKINQNVVESENIKYESQFLNAIIDLYQKNKGIQQKIYSLQEQDLIINKINQNQQIKQEQQNQNQNQLNNQENMDLLFKFNRASTNNQSPQKQPNKDVVVQQPITIQPTPQSQATQIPQKSLNQQQSSDVNATDINESNSQQKTKNQKKKQKKKNKIIKDQQQATTKQQSSRSSSAKSEINEIELIDIKINKNQKVTVPVSNNSSSQRNGKSQVVNNDNDDFFQSFQKVSKHAQKIKSKINIQKVQDKKEPQASQDQFIVLQNNYNGPNSKLEVNSSLKDYMNQKAQRKLNKQETKFIQSKVSQWQDYEKNDKLGHLGFNRMQLSQINAIVIVDKCIEIGFDEKKYQDWISTRKVWDEFVAKNIPQKMKPKLRQDIDDDQNETQNFTAGNNQMLKCRKCRADQIKKNQLYENEDEGEQNNQEDEEFFENHDPCCPNFINQNGMWNFHQTDGQKHQVRIKKLNAVKRNEVFEEKYEETREERELRMYEADRKREIIKLQEQKYFSQSDQKQQNHYTYGQAQNLISLSTNESEKIKNRKVKKEDLIHSENQMREQQIRRQRQLLIINGGKDPVQMKALQEALEKAELEKSGFCDENKKKLIQTKIAQKIHQQNINKYVYSSDEYVSGTSDESENEEIVQPQDNEERSTKSVQKPVMHNSIFAFTPYNHYDSNSSNKESDGKSQDINAKKVKTMQDLENHWKNNEKQLDFMKEESKESESLNQKQNKPPSLQNKSQLQKSVISVKSQDSSTGPDLSQKTQVASSTKPPNYKTVLCKWFEQYGKCKFEGCTYAHGQKELMFNRRQNYQSNFSKPQQTEEIKQVDDKSECEEEYYDEEYGHEIDQNDFRYKTIMCKHIQTHGSCPYINNCTFAHTKAELRKLPNYYVQQY